MKKSFTPILSFVLAAIILASVLPHIFFRTWYVDIFSHFKLQYVVTLLVLLALNCWLIKKKIFIWLIFGVTLWNLAFIVPLYFPRNPETNIPSGTSLSIVCINLLSSNMEFDQVANYIKETDADMVVLLELSPVWEEKLQEICKLYKYQLMNARHDNFGIALLSKIEMDAKLTYFGEESKPSIACDFTRDGERFTLIATHPIPPLSAASFENRNHQLEAIAHHRDKFSENFIIIGDFNTSSYSVVFRDFARSARLKDSRRGFGILPSWPTYFIPMQTTLDHCLVSENIIVSRRATGKDIGSDHLPIEVEIAL